VAALKALLSGAFLHDLSASVGWSSLHAFPQSCKITTQRVIASSENQAYSHNGGVFAA